MNRWLFPTCMFAAALLLAGAGVAHRIRRPKPHTYTIASINTAAALKQDPISSAILAIRSRKNAIDTRFAETRDQNSSRKFTPEPIISQEHLHLLSGFNARRETFSRFQNETASATIQTNFDAARAAFTITTDAEYNKLIADIDNTLRNNPPPEADESLLSLKFQLFNLRLKYDILTRDRITIQRLNLDHLKTDIDRLTSQIAAQEQKMRNDYYKSQSAATAALRESFQRDSSRRNEEFKKQMEQKLAEVEKETRKKTEQYNAKLSAEYSSGIENRNRLLNSFGAPAPTSPPPPPSAIGAISGKYEKIFMETLRRRAAAAATDRQIDIVLNNPAYTSRPALDITDQF